jgi:hypothetical protein
VGRPLFRLAFAFILLMSDDMAPAICSLQLIIRLDNKDHDSLINLAIFTGDEESFHQLSERMLVDARA